MLDWLYPQTIEKFPSKFNGEIKVTKSRGKYSVWVGGFEQSGPIYVEKFWKKALKEVLLGTQEDLLKNVLILGLGCGTLVKLISQKWPLARITGVEIDPIMISLGKKYFGLDNYKNLKIVLGNAKKQKLSGFDLVICDAYFGNKNQLDKIKAPGTIIFNNLQGVSNQLVIQ